ncbi:fibronectin type III domain-containing protein [Pseudomonas sp. LB3P31]
MTSAKSSTHRPYKISKPRISLLEDNALIFSTLKTAPTISFSYSAETSKQYSISLYCQGTNRSGQDIRLDILESTITNFASEPKTLEAELQIGYLSQLANNSSLIFTLSIKSGIDETPNECTSSTHFVNFYQTPPVRLEPFVARNNWMTDISPEIGHMLLRELLLPGAHNAGVDQDNSDFPAEFWGACQDYTFDYQLEHGIRVFDCRVRDIDPANGYFQFRHGSFHSWHVLSDLINKVEAFLDRHPQEIIILDFHEFQNTASFNYASFGSQMNFGLGDRVLRRDAINMTINEIHAHSSRRRVALCCDPVPYVSHWPKIPHKWSGQNTIDTGELNRWVNSVMQNPPIQQLWSLSVTAFGLLTGPVRIPAEDKLFIDLFAPLYTPAPGVNFKGNIINVDFFQNTYVVDNCIKINRIRGALPDTMPPTTPDAFTITNLTNTSVTVTWEASIDNNVVRGYLLTLNNNPPITVTGTSHTFNGLADATSYVIEVKSKDAAGNLSLPASLSFKIGDITPPGKPTNAIFFFLSASQAKILWNAAPDNVAVTGYVLTVNDERTITVTDTSYILDLEELTFYIIKIQAQDGAGNLSLPASVIFLSWGNLPPSEPGDPVVVKTSSTSMLVSWTASSDVAGGTVVGYTISLDDADPDTVEDTMYSFIELSEATWHSIEIKAIDNGGKLSIPAHAWFNSISDLLPSVPRHFSGSVGWPAKFTWRAPADPADLIGYEVGVTGPGGQVLYYHTTEPTLTPSTLLNKTYRIAITAYNSSGKSYPLLASIST